MLKSRRRLFFSGVAVALCFMSLARIVSANPLQIPVEVEVPPTRLVINGYAAPGAIVEVKEKDSTLSSIAANNNGSFHSVISLSPGIHNSALLYTDKSGLLSDGARQAISLQPHQDTQLEVFLAPTIKLQQLTEDKVVVVGNTASFAEVELKAAGNRLFLAKAAADGHYLFELSTEQLPPGDYQVYIKARLDLLVSEPSGSVKFSLSVPGVYRSEDLFVSPKPSPIKECTTKECTTDDLGPKSLTRFPKPSVAGDFAKDLAVSVVSEPVGLAVILAIVLLEASMFHGSHITWAGGKLSGFLRKRK